MTATNVPPKRLNVPECGTLCCIVERTPNVAAASAPVKVRNKSTIRRFGSATKPFWLSLCLAIANIRSSGATVFDERCAS
ncbi:hypothetical protein P1P68_16405 [Streptomyces scabiei]|uniref:hypothetical protein n=1 Tax=Streptomyces scabiei TaxID=1930 RepID=UPI00298F413D|nr:hypothetical protein [Streptomyces scabiei]MDW8806324.1 hypothetical protein [Streptomyces scabiei]